MQYLTEMEVGFDTRWLGFPSLRGCQAIVYVTGNGLFGFHNLGGADRPSWPGRSAAFAEFVSNHFLGGSPGQSLYGVCYATTDRGYGFNVRTEWLGEMTAFADALNFRGTIRGYDLSNSGIPNPAYAEFRKSGDGCSIWARHWVHGEETKGANMTPMHHKIIANRRNAEMTAYVRTLEAQTANIVTGIDMGHLRRFTPVRLR